MELRVLRYFLTVAREETVSRAAELLHITQPTLSRQLAQMEYDLGTTLFEHKGRRIVLTPDGMLLRRRAEEILALVDKTEQEMGQQEAELHGTIVIGYGELDAMNRLADCIAAFSEEHPHVQYQFFSGTADVVKERMDQGFIDVGLLLEPIPLDKYNFIRLHEIERYAVFMRPDDPLAEKDLISPADLAGKPLIFPHRRKEPFTSWLGEYYKEENMRYSIMLPSMGAILAARGLGYMIGIRGSIPFCDPSKLTTRLMVGGIPWHCVLAWKRGQPSSPAVEQFLQFAKCFWGIEEAT